MHVSKTCSARKSESLSFLYLEEKNQKRTSSFMSPILYQKDFSTVWLGQKLTPGSTTVFNPMTRAKDLLQKYDWLQRNKGHPFFGKVKKKKERAWFFWAPRISERHHSMQNMSSGKLIRGEIILLWGETGFSFLSIYSFILSCASDATDRKRFAPFF